MDKKKNRRSDNKVQPPSQAKMRSNTPMTDKGELYDTCSNIYDSLHEDIYDHLTEDVYDSLSEDLYNSLYDCVDNSKSMVSNANKIEIKRKAAVFLKLIDILNATINNLFENDDGLEDFLCEFSNVNDKIIEILNNLNNIISEINSKMNAKNNLFTNIQSEFVKIKNSLTNTSSILAMRNWAADDSQLFKISIQKNQCIRKIIGDLKLLAEVTVQVEELAIFEEENPRILMALSADIRKKAKSMKDSIAPLEGRFVNTAQESREPVVRKQRAFNPDEVLILQVIQNMTLEIGKLLGLRPKLMKSSRKKVIHEFAVFNAMTCNLKKKMQLTKKDALNFDVIFENIEAIISKVNAYLLSRPSIEHTCEYINQMENIQSDLREIHNNRRIYFTI